MADAVSVVGLELLGGFRLQVDGVPVNTLTSAQRLLAYLALHGPAPRVVVAGTLWADVPEEQALASLRTTMWRCNRTVRGLVAVEHSRVLLASFVRVDVLELVTAASFVVNGLGEGAGVLPALRRELLPGWYDDWVSFERERLRHLRLHALEAASRQLALAGRYGASLEYALEAVRNDPLRESAQRAVIEVHLAEHNVAEAVRAYRRFHQLLMDELGVEPSQELSNLIFVAGRAATRSAPPLSR